MYTLCVIYTVYRKLKWEKKKEHLCKLLENIYTQAWIYVACIHIFRNSYTLKYIKVHMVM